MNFRYEIKEKESNDIVAVVFASDDQVAWWIYRDMVKKKTGRRPIKKLHEIVRKEKIQ